MKKIKKGIPLIDQHDKNGYWGKFGGNFIPETLKKPVADLTSLFEKLRKDKKNDQKRVCTPEESIKNGANKIIMGRSLIKGNIEENIDKVSNSIKV